MTGLPRQSFAPPKHDATEPRHDGGGWWLVARWLWLLGTHNHVVTQSEQATHYCLANRTIVIILDSKWSLGKFCFVYLKLGDFFLVDSKVLNDCYSLSSDFFYLFIFLRLAARLHFLLFSTLSFDNLKDFPGKYI